MRLYKNLNPAFMLAMNVIVTAIYKHTLIRPFIPPA